MKGYGDETGLERGFADVVVGGQAGSEGKGAVAAELIRRRDEYGAAVRPGSTNAGHTVYRTRPDGMAGGPYVHQALPSAISVDHGVKCYMAPESSFGLGEFFEELQDAMDLWGEDNVLARVSVDPKAAVITDEHRKTERDRSLGGDIGSTVHGCGAVRAEKLWRSSGDVRLAEGYECLDRFTGSVDETHRPGSRFVGDDYHGRVPVSLRNHARAGERTLVEGTQGMLLSMNQSPHWPYTTSRDCTVASFLSSCGLPHSAVGESWAVFRSYPIRVGGNSGSMHGDEINFRTIAERAGHDEPPEEYTSVTDKLRRVFEWSWDTFEYALTVNDPDYVALTFLDYVDADAYGAGSWPQLPDGVKDWIGQRARRALETNGARIGMVKTGPRPEHAVWGAPPAPEANITRRALEHTGHEDALDERLPVDEIEA